MLTELLERTWEGLQDCASSNTGLITLSSAGALVLLGSLYVWPTTRPRDRPRSSGLSGGGIQSDRVKQEFKDYSASYGAGPGEGIIDRQKTGQLVDTFYNLVTGIQLSGER